MLPLLASENVTEPAEVPPGEVTWARNVTQESWVTDVAEAVSVVLMVVAAWADAVVGAGKPRLTAATTPQPPRAGWYQRISTLPCLVPAHQRMAVTFPLRARPVNLVAGIRKMAQPLPGRHRSEP